MAGGHATQSGVRFQNEVTALFAVHVLAQRQFRPLGLAADSIPLAIQPEALSPIDDLIVSNSDGGFTFVNVKVGVQLSQRPDSPFGSVVDQFVRQVIAMRTPSGSRAWERAVDIEKDRFVLATSGGSVGTLVEGASAVLARAQSVGVLPLADELATTASQRAFLDDFRALASHHWVRHSGEALSDADLLSLLKVVRVVRFDGGLDPHAAAAGLIADVLVSHNDQVENVWAALVDVAGSLATDRAAADFASLRRMLTARGLQLRSVSRVAQDVRRLEEYSKETLRNLRHLAHLELPDDDGGNPRAIRRDVTSALVEHAAKESFLVIGEPGGGKSAVLYAAAQQLEEAGYRTVVIAVDQHRGNSIRRISDEIGLENSIVDVLAGWTEQKPGVVLVDALDAARGGPSEQAFQGLIREIAKSVPNWRIVASIREFDLRYGVFYRDLFTGPVLDQRYFDQSFASVRHLFVKRLTDGELEQLWRESKRLKHAFDGASPALRDILRSPFNLFLMSNILRARSDIELDEVSTQVDLLDKYWSYRVTDQGTGSARRESVLLAVLQDMISERSLSIDGAKLHQFGPGDWQDLFSRGVLSPLRSRADQVILFGFSHHVLFDYATARLVLGCGQTERFLSVLASSDDLALLLSPAAMLALRMLWESDEDRNSFWDQAIKLAGRKEAGSFFRMLPSRVAADTTAVVKDWNRLFDVFAQNAGDEKGAAQFLVRHTIGALTVGSFDSAEVFGESASPWTQIVRRLTELWPDGVENSVRPLIHGANENMARLTDMQRGDIGYIARALLPLAIKESKNPSAAAILIQAVSRTFNSDVVASQAALSALLDANRVARYGYSDLFWLAHEVRHLLSQGKATTEVVADIYRAAYCNPLPSEKAETNIGDSRILSLRSNQRQDFEGARHRLAELFSEFVQLHPVQSTDVLIDALEYFETPERSLRDEPVLSFAFMGRECRLQPDWSAYWGDHRRSDAVELLKQYTSGLQAIARDHANVGELERCVARIVERNRLACLWGAILAAGAVADAAPLGLLLSPLLEQTAILDCRDTGRQAGELLAAIFADIEYEQKLRIEAAILKCGEYAQRVLLGCVPEGSLRSAAAIARRSEFARDELLLPNEDRFSPRVTSAELDPDWWLKHEGVQLESVEEQELNRQARDLQQLASSLRNASNQSDCSAAWERACAAADLHDQLGRVPEALSMLVWSAIADVADAVALECTAPGDLERFPRLLPLVLVCLADDKWPIPRVDEKVERQFEASPSWSSPSPRIGGAQALLAIARASGQLSDHIRAVIRKLAVDPRPEVRYQVLGRINLAFGADRPFVYELIDAAIRRERNAGVVVGMLGAVSRLYADRPAWFAERIVDLYDRFGTTENRRLEPLWVQSIAMLAITHRDPVARQKMDGWLTAVSQHESEILDALSFLRGAVNLGKAGASSARDDQIRLDAREFVFSVTEKSLTAIQSILTGKDAPQQTEELTNLVKVLDAVAREVYFGSGAYACKNKSADAQDTQHPTREGTLRFLREYGPTLTLLARAPYPAITHHLLETLEAFIDADPEFVFRTTMQALNEGGKQSGYQFEQLGMQLFDRIIRRYLADYRGLISGSGEFRQDLIRALDAFVECGWREARELAYELPEMLR